MRTIEEVKEFVLRRLCDIECGAVETECLHKLLGFMGSEPPCRHQDGKFYAGNPKENYKYPYAYEAKFCPDCGEKLQ